MIDYDLIIIGCGPAGMNACLYATRAGLKTLVIEKNCPGGKVVKANSVENWIGTEKISGVDLSLKMFKHAFSYGGVYEQGNVLNIINCEDHKEVVLRDKTYKCYAVIIATGTSEKKIGITGEDKFYGKGVSYCAVCDAALYKGKTVVVIGSSAHAIEETLYLSKFAQKIYLMNDGDAFDADKSLMLSVETNPIIEVRYNCRPIEIKGTDVVDEIVVESDKEIGCIKTSAVFPFLGDIPATEFIRRLNLINDKNYIVVNDKKETGILGIYAVGDCTNTPLKQIVTASGDGALAALEAYKYIKRKSK
jgi:thioredoxin reductase (NADPH)